MAIGRNSIGTILKIRNNKDAENPHKVTVQADKNFGICDIIPKTPLLTDFQGRQYNDERVIKELEEALYVELNTEEA